MAEEAAWAGTKPSHMVDVQRLPEVQADHPELVVARCCDRYAASVLLGCGGWCSLFLVVPSLGFAFLHFASSFGEAWMYADMALSIGAIIIACATCCHFCAPTVVASINPPAPAECVAPLVAKERNATHSTSSIKKVMLVYNPHAGKNLAQELMRDLIVPGFEARGIEVVHCKTEYVNHAREIGLEKDLSGIDAIIALGGDGTIHEIANGLLQRHAGGILPPLGFIPLGSGNALASDFRQSQLRRGQLISMHKEIRTVVDWALERITQGHSCCIDSLEVTAANQKVAAVALMLYGLVGEVDILAEPLRWLGPTRFDVVAIWELLKRKPMAPCEIRLTQPDGSVKLLTNVKQAGGRDWLAMVMNLGQHMTDMQRSSPTSQLDDGYAELHLYMADKPRRKLLEGFTVLPSGVTDAVPGAVETYKFTEVELTYLKDPAGDAPRGELKPGLFNVDGEVFRHNGKVHVRVRPQNLRVCCDPEDECSANDSQDSVADQGTTETAMHRSRSQVFEAYPSRWLMMWLFCLALGVNQVIWITFSPIAAVAEEQFEVQDWFVNGLSLIFMVTYVPMTLPATYFIERLGCRTALVTGSFLTFLGACIRAVAAYLSTDYASSHTRAALLMAGQFVAAVGQPFLMNMPPKLANVWFPTHQRAIADTVCSMAAPVGAAVGFLLPDMLMTGDKPMLQMLSAEAALAGGIFLIAAPLFRSQPPTPPSTSAAFSAKAKNAWVTNYQAGSPSQASPTSPLSAQPSGGPAAPLLSPLGQRASLEQRTVLSETLEALCDRDFLAIQAAFAFGQGTTNAYGTLIAQLITPFGFSEDDSSSLASAVVFSGILGAAICATILGYTNNYKGTLMGCFTISSIAGVGLAVVIPMAGRHPSLAWKALTYTASAFFGMTMTPVMPVAFEASVELMLPDVGEAVLSGLCMLGGQVVGLALTLGISALIEAGRAEIALVVIALGLLTGNIAIAFLRSKSLGERRRNHEAMLRRQRASLPTQSPLAPPGPSAGDGQHAG